ncbi:hypothetical protein ACSBO6_12175 [Bacillus sp. AL-1R]|nr:hypothetical protein CN925_13725 [Bacillus sp. AFS055030]
MIHCEWIEFKIENDLMTEEKFEEMMNDTFQAMMVDENNFPQYIWTANYVVIVTKRIKILEEVEFIQIPRNPVCS